MNVAEHPQAIDLSKRIAASKQDCIPVMIILPVQGPMTGSVRASDTPGLFILTANVDVAGTGQAQPMDFSFTADKPITIGHPDLTDMQPKSKIIQ